MSSEASGELSAARERFRTIYDTIRERIALLDYLPGQRLSEGDLAEEFGVSRTPVRRVLSRLETEGLLESRHGVGTFVTSLDREELRQVYRLRIELVGLIGILDPLAPDTAMLETMAEIQKRCREIAGAASPRRLFAQANIAFFGELLKLVGNVPLRQTLELLFYRTARMWPAVASVDDILEEAAIFDSEIGETIRCLRAGNVIAATYLRQSHISLAFARLETKLPEGNL